MLNSLLQFAERMLAQYESFIPFGGWMNNDGSLVDVGGYSGEEFPDSHERIELLVEGMREQAAVGSIKACGICIDSRVVPPGQLEKSDAILFQLEHRDGEAVEVYLPYVRSADGNLTYGQIFAQQGTRRVFAHPQ
jgi:hypothetical protein